jgi:hypothetical protein
MHATSGLNSISFHTLKRYEETMTQPFTYEALQLHDIFHLFLRL